MSKEKSFEGAKPMPEEQRAPVEEAKLEKGGKEQVYFAALEIEKRAFLEFKSKGYETLHELLETLEQLYGMNPEVGDLLLHETYDTMMVQFLQVVEIYAYNKTKSMHFGGEIDL